MTTAHNKKQTILLYLLINCISGRSASFIYKRWVYFSFFKFSDNWFVQFFSKFLVWYIFIFNGTSGSRFICQRSILFIFLSYFFIFKTFIKHWSKTSLRSIHPSSLAILNVWSFSILSEAVLLGEPLESP